MKNAHRFPIGAGVLAAVFAVLLASPLSAQQGDDSDLVNADEGIELGPFLFSPAVEVNWENRDNVFFSPDTPVEDQVWLARARLMFELPIYESYIRFSYTPQYREYDTHKLTENWTHFVDLTGNFDFASGVSLDMSYHFISGNLETREVDPGGEFIYGDRQFNKHEIRLAADYWLTETNGISVDGSFIDLTYDQPNYFYDYQRQGVGIGWLHQVNATLGLDVRYRREEFDADGTLRYRDSTSDELVVGLTGQLTPVIASELRVGWRITKFDRLPGDPAFDDYEGPLVQGFLSWDLAHGSSLKLDLIYYDFPSAYDLNAYYTATGGGLTYRLERERLFGWARIGLNRNDYDVPDTQLGETRRDDITTWTLGIGFRFTDRLSLRGSFLREDRGSLHPYSYDADVLFVGLIFGY